MSMQPPITVTSLDLERLEVLLDSPAYKDFPGADALRAELDRATIVEPQEVPSGIVTMNSTVRVAEVDSGREFELTLVYPRDSDGSPGKVSVLAPAGSALLGLAVGQTIAWPMPAGRQLQLKVLAIAYQPEAAGEYHR